MKRRVLFICTANSARSLMAEALLKEMAGDQFEVASAGTEPAQPHPMALQVLKESGIAVEGLRSKQLADLQDENWDYVITLCEKASRECGTVYEPAQQIAWDFPDPVLSGRHATFALTLKQLKDRIGLFTLVHQKETGLKPLEYNPVTVFRALGDELRLAIMMLVRDQKKLCVCELTTALDSSQPKVSRHLATLKEAGLLEAERQGQWIYYFLHTQMPQWLIRVLDETSDSNTTLVEQEMTRLQAMTDRPALRVV
ncbi:metalloregulator ArsR/SmtB family transcription factor [Marinobacter orientalis]|uniref:Metalloregulator ArsR/SmtB family transcription factor n=1 Tax=Marinobacter orientalis TaxID=1928859 RepID=A0A7Y0RAT2_9GAMM|nr:metalloregulator ArsR/SmtB family transcription factor [Marinobacter orientalis]NMT62522.1 metalloregulator ArsR/SmtB family transcription factor [Marinobacter orientalis]TGX51217.1 metalloregulator ArsR/SmtB family transcription factor [Marinobacter orientalis]